jgi:D-alanyl-D-alanine carboxypeptidase/D-alanyl-D-alanine-endopeptidase (penicillin-binding protein 4)
MKYIKLSAFFLAVLLTLLVCSQTGKKHSIDDILSNLKNDQSLTHASWSVAALNTQTGKLFVHYDHHRSLIPASTMKLFTTSTALEVLGSDFKFETRLKYSGYIDSNGVLQGNLYIIGSGDPTFGSWRFGKPYEMESIFSKWASKIKDKGIQEINGCIISDAGTFEERAVPPTWLWGDIGNYYGSGVCGINCHENLYNIFFKPGHRIGDTAKVIRTEPAIPGMEFINYVTTYKRGSGDNVYIYGGPYRQQRILRGTVPIGPAEFKVKGSIPDPPSFCALSLKNYLESEKIIVTKQAKTARTLEIKGQYKQVETKTLAKHFSPKLEEIVKKTNVKSINIFAEGLFKTIGLKIKGEGSYEKAKEAMEEFWANKGIDLSGFDMNDGSGLSRSNCVTTYQLVNMLQKAKEFSSFEHFYASLPVAGKSGSIKNLFHGHFAKENLRAKSGYMSGVRSYAGYVKNSKGHLIAFAIIVNNYESSPYQMKKKLEKLMMAIADS